MRMCPKMGAFVRRDGVGFGEGESGAEILRSHCALCISTERICEGFEGKFASSMDNVRTVCRIFLRGLVLGISHKC